MITKLLFIVLLGLFSACSPGAKDIAKSYAENIANGDIWEAKKLVTKSTGEHLDLVVKNEVVEIQTDFKFNLIKDSIVKNKAWVTYVDQNGTEEIITLIKIKGQWKVHIQ